MLSENEIRRERYRPERSEFAGALEVLARPAMAAWRAVAARQEIVMAARTAAAGSGISHDYQCAGEHLPASASAS